MTKSIRTSRIFFLSSLFLLLLRVPLCLGNAPEFDRKSIRLGPVIIEVELADNDERRTYGLMNRDSLPKNQGMLFAFDTEQYLSFWMKNTRIPLSIGFFDKNRVLIEVLEMKVLKSVLEIEIPQYRSQKPALYALEMNKSWFKENNIKPGAQWNWVSEVKKKPGT
ncbi:MAG: DUF192 domain-containing protein, partial [Bdellovibrionales bacterium]|nr:DUF192 domain-containing protein [Bdellovibrionales bacterium]